ncbi:MAG TPA: M48 family metallopeptidase [Gemmatimonadales bacterium]|nr:M48 family metallopeptidase [Gemmatimonadales bacterium]
MSDLVRERLQYAKKRRVRLPLRAALLLAAAAPGAPGCAVSIQEEQQLGSQYAAEVDSTMPVVRDTTVQRALDEAARPLVAVATRRDLAWTFRVVNTTDVNAFAIPGGHIYVTRGLIEHATSYDQLAGVVGHEIGHVDLRHSAKQIEKQRAATLGVGLGYVVLGRDPGKAEGAALNVVAAAVFARFSREDERAADHAAVRYTTAAGIDPDGLVEMFHILEQVQGTDPDAISQFFASHPMTADRISDVQQVIAADPAARRAARTGRKDAPVFHELLRAVRVLPPPPKAKPGA